MANGQRSDLPVTAAARRLESLRSDLGYESLRGFWRELMRDGEHGTYDEAPSYASVRSYHRNREPPAHYFARVAAVTGASLRWLMTGDGPMYAAQGQGPLSTSGWVSTALSGGVSEESEPCAAFYRGVPFLPEMSPFGLGVLDELCQRLLADAEDEWLSDEDVRMIVSAFLRLPYEKFGLDAHPSSPEYTNYVMAVVHALLLVIPGRRPA